MNLALLYCDSRTIERGIVSDPLPDQDRQTVEPVACRLRALGHRVSSVGLTFDVLEELPGVLAGFDAVFNLCDGSGIDGMVGPSVPAILQDLGLPFTGCSADPYVMSIDKAHVRERLEQAGLPVPEGGVYASEERLDLTGWSGPVIVKPREGFGSLGIDRHCVVHEPARLPAAVRRARRASDGDVLIERFLSGRELSVSVLGPADAPLLLPAVEFHFGPAFARMPRIRTLRSKHDPTSAEYHDIGIRLARLTPSQQTEIEGLVRSAWRVVGGDGYGRIDLRLDDHQRPFLIDVNLNCSLEIGSDALDCGTLVQNARLAGWRDQRLLKTILEVGLLRSSRRTRRVRAAISGRWTPEHGHALHALRPIDAGEVLARLRVLQAGRGTRRPWRIGHEWVAPAPPVRWARAAPAPSASAQLVEQAGDWLLSASRPIARFEEIQVNGRRSRRGTLAVVQPPKEQV